VNFYTRSFTASTLLFIGLSMSVLASGNYALAQAASPAKKSVAVKSKGTEVAMVSADDDGIIPDINNSTTNEYKCELNDSLTIYSHENDDNRTALRWKNRLYGLKRIATTTGANRFENKKAGLVWIGIPTKGMLLDSIRGQQLANECKTASQ